MFTDLIILAGGAGSRLWPVSNSAAPKQFMTLGDGSSFFDTALDRAFAILRTSAAENQPATGVNKSPRLIIVAGQRHQSFIQRAVAGRPADDQARTVLIPEPLGRNTAPAIACAVAFIRKTAGPGRRALVLTSDHLIGPLEAFVKDVEAADALARQKWLVVFGIRPTEPATGFGYIEAGKALASKIANGRTFTVVAFHEKPDLACAERYLASGGFTWNSGMFGFNVDMLLEEYNNHAPSIYEAFMALKQPTLSPVSESKALVLNHWPGLQAAYTAVPTISLDKAVVEKCRQVALIKAAFDWRDIGSWDEYARLREANFTSLGKAPDNANAVFSVESTGCFVDSDLPVALCGVDDLIIVLRTDPSSSQRALLVCRKGSSQSVKRLVDKIKSEGREDLL